MFRFLSATFALLAALAFAIPAHAAFPEKPIRIVVAFAPGSSTDIVARLVAEQLSASLGQPVVVENRPGAGGNIATTGVMNAAPDGHTLLVHSVAYSVNPSLFANAGYHPLNDLQAVAMAASTPNLLYVHPDVKANNLGELLALARNSKMAYASSGIGTTTQLGAELLFRELAKVDITHVPFQPAAATNAVVSGQVPIASTSMPPAVPFVKAGRVRPIAVTSSRRAASLPDVPTVAELGYRDFEATTWIAIFAPAKTPTAVLDLLNTEINKAIATRAVQERFATLSLEAVPMDRAQMRGYVEGEAAKWGKLVRALNIKAE
ncbi:MAG TPA: tripartite tricarboxylate transporter substrate binding protein [Ramlibacter sp.]|jgi:tripartite-type tricarboxylate transporter receptor subunit TctC|nr:tripartite tricarboxylate transporter substrate binding protein [Ramlibacter sp.]